MKISDWLAKAGKNVVTAEGDKAGKIAGKTATEVAEATAKAAKKFKNLGKGIVGASHVKSSDAAKKLGELARSRFSMGPRKAIADTRLKPLTKEQLKNKPRYSPDLDKWTNPKKGGHITIDEKGTWRYHDWEGNSVSYPDGYPDFKSAGMVKQEVPIGKPESYPKDFAKADELAPNGPKAPENTWHHHQDGTTMQEIDRDLHRRFTHEGGMSGSKK